MSYYTRHASGMTFTVYATNQKIRKLNNVKILGKIKTKGLNLVTE